MARENRARGCENTRQGLAPGNRPNQIACPVADRFAIAGKAVGQGKAGPRTEERQWQSQDKPKPMQERSSRKNASRFPRPTCEQAKAPATETPAACNEAAWF